MAPHSSTLAWKIPWMEEPGRLQSMGLLRVGHDWATSLSLFTFMHWRRKWQPTPVFLPGEFQGRGSLVGCRLWGRKESDTTEWMNWTRLVTTFLPRSKRLLISWLQSPSAVILEPPKIKSVTISTVCHLFAMKWWDWMPWPEFSEFWVLSQPFHSPFSVSSRVSLVLLHFLP